MPVADTELLFLLNPKDPRHEYALRIVEKLKGRLYVPDTALLESEVTLRSRGRSSRQVVMAFLALKKIFIDYDIKEICTLNLDTMLLHLDLVERYKLSYFNSLLAASAISVDSIIVSDDKVFDNVMGLKRIPITR